MSFYWLSRAFTGIWLNFKLLGVCVFYRMKDYLHLLGYFRFLAWLHESIVFLFLRIFLKLEYIQLLYSICVSFCHTMKYISHIHTYIPSLSDLPSSPLSSHPSRSLQNNKLSSPCYTVGSHWLGSTRGNAHTSIAEIPAFTKASTGDHTAYLQVEAETPQVPTMYFR